MAKKDFSTGNFDAAQTGVNTGGVFDVTEKGKTDKQRQTTASFEEQKQRIDELRTRGRKGCRLPRINMTFSGANYDYIQTVSRATGQSMTAFLNSIIDEYRKEKGHREVYEKAKQLLQELES